MASGTKINIDLVLNTKGFRPLGRINGQLGEFEKSLDASNARVLAFGASAGAILAVKKAFTATVASMIEVERSLQDINVILNTSTTNLKKFGSDLFTIASQTGQSFKVAAAAATELARQGLGLQETLKRTKDALILARLSGMDATEAVMSLTAALNTFNQVGLDSTAIINKLANVDAAFAVSSDDLAKALGRVGASAKGAGVSLDELLAVVTTAQQKTARGGAVIGNSFKTIFTRIQRPRVIGQLEELGIRVKDLQGATLPAMKVLGNLARQFDNLTQTQQAQISELVGGVFQVNILKAAMADLSNEQSIYNSALKISAGSTDEAIQRNTRLNETLSAQFNRTVNSFKEGAAELGTLTLEPALRNLLNVGDAIADASKSEASVAKAGQFIGKSLFGAIGKFIGGPGLLIIGFTLFKTFKQLGTFAADAFKTLTGLNKNFQTQLNLQKQIFDVLSENPDLMAKIKNGTITVEDAHKEIFDQIEKNTGALDRQLLVSKQLAESLAGGGIGISPDFGATKGGPRKFGSHGYVPNFAKDKEEMWGMMRGGYSDSQIRNPKTRKARLFDGLGSSHMATINGHESVIDTKNRKGNKATFVVPPKGTEAYDKYMSSLAGGFPKKKKGGYSGGLIPNFAGGQGLRQFVDEFRGPGSLLDAIVAGIAGGTIDARGLQGGKTPAGISHKQIEAARQKGKLLRDEAAAKPKLGRPKAKPGSKIGVDFADVGGQYGVVSLFGKTGQADITGKKSKITLLKGLGGKGAPPVPDRITIGGFKHKSYFGETEKGGKANQFATIVREELSEPFANVTERFANEVAGLKGENIAKLDGANIAKSKKALFPQSAEGAIFEAAMQGISKGTEAFKGTMGGETNQTWDFDGSEQANEKFKNFFGMKGVLFADGKRSVDGKVEGNLVNKIFNTLGKKKSKGKGSRSVQNIIKNAGGTITSGGYIPNFNELFESVRRERDAGVPEDKIRVGKDGSLKSSKNPLGLGIFNTDDEPRGLRQGINRTRRRGGDPKKSGSSYGYVPNFAPKGGGGLFDSMTAKLVGGMGALYTVTSTLEQAMGQNTVAIHLIKTVENALIGSVGILVAATHLLRKSNEKLTATNKDREKAGKAPLERQSMTDMFTKKGRSKIGARFREGKHEAVLARKRGELNLGDGGNMLQRMGTSLQARATKRRGRPPKLGSGKMAIRAGAGVTRAMGAVAPALSSAGVAMGGIAMAAGPVIAGVGAVAAAAYGTVKMFDGINQSFKVRDMKAANDSFQAISKKNEALSNDLSAYSKALQSFKDTLTSGDASVQQVMNGLAALNASLSKMSPEVRRKFQTTFDPRAAQTLLGEEQERAANQTRRAQNRVTGADLTERLGKKESIQNQFALQFSGLGFGDKINEKSTDLDFKNLAQSILTSDENVDFSKTMAGKSGAERGEIMAALGSGDAKRIEATMTELGYGEETIASFSSVMDRSGTAGKRLSEAMANNAIETNRANIEMAILSPIIEKFAKATTEANREIFQMQRALEVERSIMKEVQGVMQKGANLFLGEVGQIDLQSTLEKNVLKGDKAEKVGKAGQQLSKAFSNQADIEHLQKAFGGRSAGGVEKAQEFQGQVQEARKKLQSTDTSVAEQGRKDMDQLGEQLTDMMKTEGQKHTVDALNRLNTEMAALTQVEEGAARELEEQTDRIDRVAEAQKQLVEIQRQIGEAGGMKFEGLGENLKKMATADLLGRVASQSGSEIGAARFATQKFDAIQHLQGGKGTLTAEQRSEAMAAATTVGQGAYGAMQRTGQFKDEMFDAERQETAIGRKAAARYGSDDIKDAGADVEASLDKSQGDIDSVMQKMQAISDKSLAQEEAVLKQIETLAEATKQLNESTDKMVADQKEAFSMSEIKAPGGMFAKMSGLGPISDLAKVFMTAMDTRKKGAAAERSGMGNFQFTFKKTAVDKDDLADLNKHIAGFNRETNETAKALGKHKGGLSDYKGTASANSVLKI
jgi:TP901 family phage tail tape measure protein